MSALKVNEYEEDLFEDDFEPEVKTPSANKMQQSRNSDAGSNLDNKVNSPSLLSNGYDDLHQQSTSEDNKVNGNAFDKYTDDYNYSDQFDDFDDENPDEISSINKENDKRSSSIISHHSPPHQSPEMSSYDVQKSTVQDEEYDKFSEKSLNLSGVNKDGRKSVNSVTSLAPPSANSIKSRQSRAGRQSKRPSAMAYVQNRGRQSKAQSETAMSPHRLLSARRVKIDDLRTEIRAVIDEIESLKLENKAMRRNNVLQHKQLEKWEKQEQDLPSAIDRHMKEIKTLSDFLRRQEEKYERNRRKLKETDRRLYKSEKEAKILEDKAKENDLEERDKMRRRLEILEQESLACDDKIRQLERYAENLEKNFLTEMNLEIQKHQQTMAELEQVKNDLVITKRNIQAKESALEQVRFERISVMRGYLGTANSDPLIRKNSLRMIGYNNSNQLVVSTADSTSNPRTAASDGPMRDLKALPALAGQQRHEIPDRCETRVMNHPNSQTNNTIQPPEFTPSPPANRRAPEVQKQKQSPRHRVNKPTKPSENPTAQPESNVKEVLLEKPTPSVSQRSSASEEQNRVSMGEWRKAELMRTNIALSQANLRNLHDEDKIQSNPHPVEREDSWEAIRREQEKITHTNPAAKPPTKSSLIPVSSSRTNMQGSTVSLSQSVREQTFAIIKESEGSPPPLMNMEGMKNSNEEEAARRNKARRLGNQLQSGNSTLDDFLVKDMPTSVPTETNQKKKTIQSIFNSTSKDDFKENDIQISNDSLDFGSYKPSVAKEKPTNRRQTSNLSTRNDGIVLSQPVVANKEKTIPNLNDRADIFTTTRPNIAPTKEKDPVFPWESDKLLPKRPRETSLNQIKPKQQPLLGFDDEIEEMTL